jgi:hypothetical protein
MWVFAETEAYKVDTNYPPRHLLPLLEDFKRYTVGDDGDVVTNMR